MFRALNVVMLLVFLLCIAVQYNDPDSVTWMFFYGVPAVLTLMAIRRRYTWVSLLAAAIYFIGFVYWVPRTTIEHPSHLFTDLQMHEKGIEEAREAFGLLICAVWVLVIGIAWLKSRRAAGVSEPSVTAKPSLEQ
jgi:hypothetical protein